MTGVCDKCPNWMEEVKAVSPLDDPVEWYQWERVEKAVPGKKGKPSKTKKKIQKVVKEGTVDEAISALHQKLPAFLHHVFVKRKQSRFFEEKMSNLSQDEALVQVDFAENYSCRYQDEVQAAHWHQQKFSSQAKVYMVHDICNPIKSDDDDDDDDNDDGNDDDDDGEDSDGNDGDDDDGSVFCQS